MRAPFNAIAEARAQQPANISSQHFEADASRLLIDNQVRAIYHDLPLFTADSLICAIALFISLRPLHFSLLVSKHFSPQHTFSYAAPAEGFAQR